MQWTHGRSFWKIICQLKTIAAVSQRRQLTDALNPYEICGRIGARQKWFVLDSGQCVHVACEEGRQSIIVRLRRQQHCRRRAVGRVIRPARHRAPCTVRRRAGVNTPRGQTRGRGSEAAATAPVIWHAFRARPAATETSVGPIIRSPRYHSEILASAADKNACGRTYGLFRMFSVFSQPGMPDRRLYVLPALILLAWRSIISGSTELMFTIFSPNGRHLNVVWWSEPLKTLKGRYHGN